MGGLFRAAARFRSRRTIVTLEATRTHLPFVCNAYVTYVTAARDAHRPKVVGLLGFTRFCFSAFLRRGGDGFSFSSSSSLASYADV